jgi:predicted TPR repeat methyltransferase
MQISKKQLKQIISEEMVKIASEKDNLDTLLEGYAAGYDSDEQTVSKEAVIDFLNVLEESHIPLDAFHALMENLPENVVAPILKDVLSEDEE